LDWARAAWLKACELDDIMACALFAESHDGIGAESEPEISLTYHEQACAMGLGSSCGRAGYYYESGTGTAEDTMMAADLYAKGCDLGSAYDCERLGGIYEILDSDPVQFVQNQIQACANGDTYRCSFVASDFESGAFDLPKSPEIAAVLKRIGCEDDPECSSP